MFRFDMDTKELLLSLFDDESGIYPLHIIPTGMFAYGAYNPRMPETYSGIHFVDTASLLSICSEVPEVMSVDIDEQGKIIEDDRAPVIHFESVEIGIWCKALLQSGDATMLEHTDIPWLFKHDDFDEFERLAKGSISKLTAAWCIGEADRLASEVISTRSETFVKLPTAFYGYYSVLQGLILARTGNFVHEASALIEAAPQVATFYSEVLKRIKTDNAYLSRREASMARFEIRKTIELLVESFTDSDLPDSPSKECIKSIDEELLRLRRALL